MPDETYGPKVYMKQGGDEQVIKSGGIVTIEPGGLIDGSAAANSILFAAGAVTFAKANVFVSTEQTGTGSAQNIAHGLGAVPAAVLIVPTDTAPVTVGLYTAIEGAHDITNVVATVTSGKKYKVLAWA